MSSTDIMTSEAQDSSGVQRLIDRLHEEGVSKGKEQAESLLVEARAEAMSIVDEAKAEAERIERAAREEAERTTQSGEEAVRLAARDAILKLSEQLRDDFVRKLQGLVGHALSDTEFLKRLIAQIVQQALPEETRGKLNLTVLEPLLVVGASNEELRVDEETLQQFFLELGGETLREGFSLQVAEAETEGLRIRLVEEELEVDLTTETVTQLLLSQLAPRYRAIFEDA